MPIRWIKPTPKQTAAAVANVTPSLGAALGVVGAVGVALRALLEAGVPVHDPPLTPRDEAVFLLHTAAEIEHALLVQYLYAAFSLKTPEQIEGSDPENEKQRQQLRQWKGDLLSIAKEEMGHLMTVQNLLLLIGAPLNFEREAMPFKSQFYPFHFRLEPLTKGSLAKYVLAEKPEDREHKYLTEAQEKDLMEHAAGNLRDKDAKEYAAVSGGVLPVNRVGALYAKLYCLVAKGDEPKPWVSCDALTELLGEPVKHLADEDFLLPNSGISDSQAPKDVWDLSVLPSYHILVPKATTRAEALDAIQKIGEQGEAGGGTVENEPSHFHRFFFNIYQEFPEPTGPGVWLPSNPVASNPNTLLDPPRGESKKGNISHPRARQWAELFNLRYRILLNYLAHYLQPVEKPPTRDFLTSDRIVGEMGWLTGIATKLVAMPRGKKTEEFAGPPFELPYTLSLPVRDRDHWRLHLYVHDLVEKVIDTLSPSETPENKTFLANLKLSEADRKIMNNNANPPATPPTPPPAAPPVPPAPPNATGAVAKDNMLKLIAFLKAAPHNAANRHLGVDLGNGQTLTDLFADPETLLTHLQTKTAINDDGEVGKPLVVPGKPDDSAFFRLIQRAGHPMKPKFALGVPGTEAAPGAPALTGVEIVKNWINSLT